MSKLRKNLKKYFYVETVNKKVNGEFKAIYIVWYANYITLPIFGKRYTVILGLNFHVTGDIKAAYEYLEIQKDLYKTALICR